MKIAIAFVVGFIVAVLVIRDISYDYIIFESGRFVGNIEGSQSLLYDPILDEHFTE